MNQNITNAADASDEIDLVKLMFDLWKRKLTIIIVTVIFALASIAYALLAPQVWTSHAVLAKAEEQNMQNYLTKVEQYNAILNINNSNLTVGIFNKFKEAAQSRDNQFSFFEKTSLVKALMDKGLTKEKAINSLLKNLTITQPKDDKTQLNVSFSYDEPAIAQKTLQQFLGYIQQKVGQEIIKNSMTKIELKTVSLNMQLRSIEQNVGSERVIKLRNLNHALSIAKDAGIVNYTDYKNNKAVIPNTVGSDAIISIKDSQLYNDNFLFLLGEKYLKAQIKALETMPLAYPEKYYLLKAQIKDLSKLMATKNIIRFDTFSFQSSPSYPENRDKPKRSLIVIAGTFVGGILGILLALLLNTIASYKARNKE